MKNPWTREYLFFFCRFFSNYTLTKYQHQEKCCLNLSEFSSVGITHTLLIRAWQTKQKWDEEHNTILQHDLKLLERYLEKHTTSRPQPWQPRINSHLSCTDCKWGWGNFASCLPDHISKKLVWEVEGLSLCHAHAFLGKLTSNFENRGF